MQIHGRDHTVRHIAVGEYHHGAVALYLGDLAIVTHSADDCDEIIKAAVKAKALHLGTPLPAAASGERARPCLSGRPHDAHDYGNRHCPGVTVPVPAVPAAPGDSIDAHVSWCMAATPRAGHTIWCDVLGPHTDHHAPGLNEGDPDIIWTDQPARTAS